MKSSFTLPRTRAACTTLKLYFLALATALAALPASAQWQILPTPTTSDLRGIHTIGNGIAWASGTNGTVLRTTDDGAHWVVCSTPPGAGKLDFRGIQAFDASTAIVMSSGKGDLSRLYKTTDGCQTWSLIFTNRYKEGFWDALIFFDKDRQRGYLLGDPVQGAFQLFFTYDGGANWRSEENPAYRAQSSKQGAFAASNSSLYTPDVGFGSGGTAGAYFYFRTQAIVCLDATEEQESSPDCRDRWSRKPVPIGSKSASSGIFSLAFQGIDFTIDETNGKMTPTGLNSKSGVAVGGDYLKSDDATGTAAFSLDGGYKWTAAQTPPHGYRSSVAYSSTTKTWITVGPNGTDISTDDGRNWRALKPTPTDPPDADRNWNALSLPFVVGPHGRIGKLHPEALQPPKSGAKSATP